MHQHLMRSASKYGEMCVTCSTASFSRTIPVITGVHPRQFVTAWGWSRFLPLLSMKTKSKKKKKKEKNTALTKKKSREVTHKSRS